MKNMKRYLAIAAIILLGGLYVATFVFALIESPFAHTMFMACLYATIVLPVLLYGMILVYRNINGDKKKVVDTKTMDKEQADEKLEDMKRTQDKLEDEKLVIDTVIFDVGKVLVEFDWKTYLESFGYDEERNKALAAAMFEHPMWDEADRGALTEKEIEDAFVENASQYEAELRALYETPGKTITLMDYACEWIEDLKRQGKKVYILSNYSKRVYRQTKDEMKFLSLVDGALFSYECQMIKPERGIYEELLGRFDIDPKHAVFIDDRQVNIDGGEAVGIRGIRFTTYEEAKRKLEELLQN